MHNPLSHAAPAALAILFAASALSAGPLNPPAGSITSTPGPEPRIAINASNTPGDAGSTFLITQPGSYILTANIVGQAGKRGIGITSPGVTIDLNGFELLGVPGSLDGIASLTANVTNIEVRNGSVRSWSEDGIDFAFFATPAARIVNVRSSQNGLSGIRASNNSAITNCTAGYNGQHGITVEQGCAVTDCSLAVNTADAVNASLSCLVTRCAVYGGGGNGILAGAGSSVTGCLIYSTQFIGINVSSSSTVSGNTVRNCDADGIRVSASCFVSGNTCVANGQASPTAAGILVAGADNRIEGNNCLSQDVGVHVSASRNLIIRNSCSGNTTNWDIVANNVYGPIIDRSSAATAAATGNAAASTLGSTDPNANYTF